jgi:hypothetical protein
LPELVQGPVAGRADAAQGDPGGVGQLGIVCDIPKVPLSLGEGLAFWSGVFFLQVFHYPVT